MTEDPRQDVIRKLARDRVLAHRVLFAHRHPSETPEFHEDIIRDWHSPIERVVDIVFRGGAKSTLAEEAITVLACFRDFRNCVVLGESETRAKERLTSIKNELNTNPYIEDLFGDLGEGSAMVWTETKVVLSNGVCLQALGRGQSLRGIKHLDQRPDLLFVDDLEDAESVADPEQRQKWRRWFFSVVLPAMVPPAERRIRVAGTPLDRDALLEHMAADKRWHTRRIPIKHVDPDTGTWRASWPARFPLAAVDEIEKEFRENGEQQLFAQEYMCVAEDPAQKPFTRDMFRVEPVVRDWQAVYAMFDPARTVKEKTSATTGVAVWSWINNRLIVWESYARFWKPDEIIADMFRVGDAYAPVVIGVEQDGLEEFILQPLRQGQVNRGVALPVRPLKAPKGKIDFIKGLQPFFNAREVIFAKPLPDLEQQLLAFPTGRIDAPNALAYALSLRPGSVIYDGFSVLNIAADIEPYPGVEPWLAVNVSAFCTTGMLVQQVDGALVVLADWAREGDAGLALPVILKEAGVEAGRAPRLIAPPDHFDKYDTLGLRAAATRIPIAVRRGGELPRGKEEIRALLGRTVKGLPGVRVSTRARWTLNGFSGGYARPMKRGVLSEHAEDGVYRTLFEGLEAFAALMRVVDRDDPGQSPHWQTTQDGRKYMSAKAVVR